MVGREVVSGGVSCCHCIGLVWRSGGDAVIYFLITSQTEGAAYSVSDGSLCWLRWRRQKVKLARIVGKCNAEMIIDKI